MWDPYYITRLKYWSYRKSSKICLENVSQVMEFKLWTIIIIGSQTTNTQRLVRRSALSLGHLYKIINKLTYYPEPPIIQRKIPYRNRGINANTVCIPHATTTAYQQSFYPKTLSVWNSLPEGVTRCTISFLRFRVPPETIKLVSIYIFPFKSHLFQCRHAFKFAIILL